MKKRRNIDCPYCGKKVAELHWAPGYPGMWPHKGKDGQPCARYIRYSKVDGRPVRG